VNCVNVRGASVSIDHQRFEHNLDVFAAPPFRSNVVKIAQGLRRKQKITRSGCTVVA
jgi:hypothetical protein